MHNKNLLIISFLLLYSFANAQLKNNYLWIGAANTIIQPLDTIMLHVSPASTVKIVDGCGREYVQLLPEQPKYFIVAGALGRQMIKILNAKGKLADSLFFEVSAKTGIDDGGYYCKMFYLFYKGMFADEKINYYNINWNKNSYNVFVPWVLDNYHTMKGKKYFLPNAGQLVDLMRQAQRKDGMIYSFVQYMSDPSYFLTRDKLSGYSTIIGDKAFVRQPVENHPEYIFVNSIYDCWKSNGNDEWMKSNLPAAQSALDYCLKDPVRWSKKFLLLKRVYTIDSWDFAVEDEYLPNLGLTNSMIIDSTKSKFGIFFGDNTGYITACYQLAEMFLYTGNQQAASLIMQRGLDIKERLDKLSWNGRYFTHFIEEDSSVYRKLGVDERSQIAQSNAYSLNRNISSEQSVAIINTYQQLKNKLPDGSPGEWYSIYPPFKKGFGTHNEIWQYMNGGVGGHVAGELARGAYANGFENYATDILNRLFELGKKYDNKIYFAYTGAFEKVPAPPVYRSVPLHRVANMSNVVSNDTNTVSWMNNKRLGDDISTLPVGKQVFAGIPFLIIQPDVNNLKNIVAVSTQKGFDGTIDVNINDKAGCIYLLHTSSKPASENIVASLKFKYIDGTTASQYLIMEKHITYWWFPQLINDFAGIAWKSSNKLSESVGLSWCAINNPFPIKQIASISFQAAEGGSIYALAALTLADKPHYVPVKATSYGGPDDWAASTAMAAMIEGLAGIKENQSSQAYLNPVVSPRWITANADSVKVTVKYAASSGYVAYKYHHKKATRTIMLTTASSGKKINYHILLPTNFQTVKSVTINNKSVFFKNTSVQSSSYIDFESDDSVLQVVMIEY
jgi:hypothetical protein